MASGDEDAAHVDRSKLVPFAAGVYAVPAAPKRQDVNALRAELKGDIRALKTMLAKADDRRG